MTEQYDVIVVGSGITGGWAAKEFCEKGFKTLVLERGRHLDHPDPEYTDMTLPWELYNRGKMSEMNDVEKRYRDSKRVNFTYNTGVSQFFVDEKEHPYSTNKDHPSTWIRGYQLGGKSITWARQAYRWGPKDFEANKKDGNGIAWPIGYDDLAPWYDYVEAFAGISGNKDGLDVLPDGNFLKPWEMSCAEEFVAENVKKNRPDRPLIMGRCANLSEARQVHQDLGRGACQARNQCMQGCSFGANFCSLSSTLPAARRTGNLAIQTDAIVSTVEHDPVSGKAIGVTVIDAKTKAQKTYSARVIFLCASTFGSLQILLNSKSERFPTGLGNSSNMLGHYIIDHFVGAGARGTVPGFEDRYSFGRRPTGIYVPNFRHDKSDDVDFVRGYGYQGSGKSRPRKSHTGRSAGIGAKFKADVGTPMPWRIGLGMAGEMLPYYDNTVTLHKTKIDKWGIPLVHIDASARENEYKMFAQAAIDAEEILIAGGCINVVKRLPNPNKVISIGSFIHEMGGAGMGADPKGSVLNKWAQSHDVPNLFVTDGACMSSCATQNPSLTYMAITARSANHAAELMSEGIL
ncbi:MAG: GMC oxidoreductase [Litorimonas sp.]